MVGALSVFNNAVTDAALFKLRKSEPDLPRPFKAIGYPWLPALILLIDVSLVALFLMSNLKSAAFMIGGLAVIFPISMWMKRRRSDVA